MSDNESEIVLDLTDWDGTVPEGWADEFEREDDDPETSKDPDLVSMTASAREDWAAEDGLGRAEARRRLGLVIASEAEYDARPENDPHHRAVAHAIEQLRVRDEARRAFQAETYDSQPFDAGTLTEILARDPEPLARVEGLLPWEAGLLLIAERKAGKTTASLNLARSLVTGEDFLGSLPVRPIDASSRVGFMNFEVSGATFARWAAEVGVPADRLYLVNLRGRSNPFSSEDDLARLADMLREQRVESLFVDPFGRAFDGDSQNDNSQVGRFLDRLDTWARGAVGTLDLILTAHAGHLGEHVRGASTLEGWADVNAYLTRQGTGASATRYLRAEGRDIDLPESGLAFDLTTRLLALSGGSRADAGQRDALDHIERLLTDAGAPMSGRAIEDALDGIAGRDDVRAALRYGETSGRLMWELGPKRAHLWTVIVMPEFVNGDADDDND